MQSGIVVLRGRAGWIPWGCTLAGFMAAGSFNASSAAAQTIPRRQSAESFPLQQEGGERPARWAVPVVREGLPNLHKVSEYLYRGAQPSDEGFAQLSAMGIKTVVNLRTFHSDRQACERNGLDYVHINAQAWEAEDEEVIEFLKVVADKDGRPVFVHCQHGADRTGMMCAVYRVAVQGWSREEAIREMTEGGFGFHAVWQNLVDYVRDVDVEVLKRRAGLEAAPVEKVRFERPPPDSITFWGHACMYIDIGGVGVITDPMFDQAYSPLSRRIIGAPTSEACANVRLILISHAHTDHLSPKSLGLFPDSAKILCPPPCAEYLGGRDFKTLRPWEEYRQGETVVVAVPARHPGGKYSLKVSDDGGALGYVVRFPGAALYYSGDTDYFEGFAQVRRRYAPDIAILNINRHLHSDGAARAVRALGAQVVIPAHFGAFDHPLASRVPAWHDELKRSAGPAYREIQIGGTLRLDSLFGDR